jgi:HAD superfamily hydrolase (TIGR01509 family)
MAVSLVMFDLDGTLVDAYDAVHMSLNEAFSQHQYPQISHEEIKRNVGWGETHLVRQFVKPEDLNAVLNTYRAHHRSVLPGRVRFLPGVEQLLSYLKSKDILVALATNRPRPFTEIIVKDMGLDQHLHDMICGDEVESPKPSGDMLRIVMDRLGYLPDQCLYVGDMTVDALAGHDAGVCTIVVTTGSCTRGELMEANAQAIVDNIEHVQRFIN